MRERVANIEAVPAGEVRVLTCGGRELAVANLDGEVYAIDNVCSHDGGPLGEGHLHNGRIICPRHGAAFDPKTGRALTLPAVRGVRAYPAATEDGGIYIDCLEQASEERS